jgi:hypothetical protein
MQAGAPRIAQTQTGQVNPRSRHQGHQPGDEVVTQKHVKHGRRSTGQAHASNARSARPSEDNQISLMESDVDRNQRGAFPPATEQGAAILFRQGRFDQAARVYQMLSERHPERLDLLARLGYLDLLANDPCSAVARLSDVLDQGLRTREILSHLAEAYYRAGDLGPAALCYQQLGREGLAGTLAAMADLEVMRLRTPHSDGELSWVAADPLPVIRAKINGEEANLVLDTGAGDSALDTHFAIAAGVRLGGQEWRDFAGGRPAQVTHGHAEQLELGAARIDDLPMQVFDLQAVFGHWFPDLTIHGILGIRAMSLFHCTFDYRSGLLRLEPRDSVRRLDTGVPIWLAENWMLLTHTDFPSLRQALVFLDSGMTGGAFAVSESRAAALGVRPHAAPPLIGTGGGGEITGTGGYAEALRLDTVRRRGVPGLLLDALAIETRLGYRINGLIGHDFLRGTRLTLDFAGMRLGLVQEQTDCA